ncbi:hypothetical protein TBLA_0C03910 [Henningerozyma blattae CBS 6284]|uniref:Nucleoporin Nup54 alpha-helical domain-containing protein n=1 Tax=Henningerozyma blattae (strain ATCC 34711 / CBS 6284 / DSM 70876 / NBRC 10599 / NRRL Y-10934 / UCD 77-7) TaxID=1071380 RepID=I2H1E0_HENB6|nr:hypothetical protein TBLA_0C03910 [Tetrapisispora blattae CBS 6284]CCH60192.1 hypothetical protein TBLA_0C03910 [Tetrapisispora blattae CBS 6284]
MFGQANTASQSNSIFGAKPAGSSTFSFGQSNNQQQNNTASNNNTFSFGGNSNNAINNNSAPSNSLFGAQNQTNTTNTSGGLFGSQANTSNTGGGLFGSQSNTTNVSGGLFGNKPLGSTLGTSTTTQQPTTSNSLFGNSNTSQQTNTSNSLFGSKPTIGGATTTSSTLGGGGLFGSTQNNSTGGFSSGGLFGNKPATTTGGGLFGSSTQNTSTLGGNTGLFGQQQQPQQPQQQQQPSLFDGNTVSSSKPSFAWSNQQGSQNILQQQQQQNSLVAQQQQRQLVQQQLAQQQHSNYAQQIQEQLIKCKESWDPTSSKLKLRSFVYNKVTETEALLYNKPPNVSQEEWNQALEGKPKTNNFIPIQILGFEDLNKRNQLQRENVAQCRTILNQLLEKTTQLQQKHELDTAARILKAQSRNIEIERRILRLGSQIAILKSRGLPLSISEEKLWTQFQTLLDRSRDPAGLGKTNELWARLAVLKERTKAISDQLDSTLVIISENGGNSTSRPLKNKQTANTKSKDTNGESVRGVDEEVEDRADKIATILSNQQRGIIYLNEVLDKDKAYIDNLR